ncbi:MBL fold metallo-hydrolase [Candidatus Giovannonibacteria bacterium]|nr:MBL fold metallo-hydrolase [Candidatus Giovannonibacteria bacterium]
MVITYYGASCFKVQSGDLTIAFDPPSKGSDLKPPRFECHVVLSSHDHPLHNGLKELPGKKGEDPFFISGPGEYEYGGLQITAIQSFHDNTSGKKLGTNTIYVVEMENIRLCHLGDLGQGELEAESIEVIGKSDVLFVPVGGKDVIDAETAAKIITQLEPRVVIPMHYAILKTALKGARVDEFLKELGEEKIKPEDKFTFKKKELPEDGMKVVLLEPVISL